MLQELARGLFESVSRRQCLPFVRGHRQVPSNFADQQHNADNYYADDNDENYHT